MQSVARTIARFGLDQTEAARKCLADIAAGRMPADPRSQVMAATNILKHELDAEALENPPEQNTNLRFQTPLEIKITGVPSPRKAKPE